MDTSFSSREQRIAILSILLVLALESVAFVAWTYYPSADMYYNELTTQNILEEGGLPEFDPTVFGGRHHLYPPLLDYHTAYLIQLTGATYLLLFRFLPFVILPVYFMLSFSLSGFFTKRSETRILASLLFVTVPFVTFQYASIHAGPTLGLLLSLFVFYAFLRHTRTQTLAPLVLLSLFSSLLLLTHLRSFILTYAVLTVFL
ncbi:MAG: hypothetical protein JXB14_00165, partial [Candidatus Altiarchaeota archaeon]|nr:hypothetical protein [Candidatus Altiarchaeota archaeon]